MNIWEKLFLAALLVGTGLILLWSYREDVECEKSGGKRVRTTFSYECVKVAK